MLLHKKLHELMILKFLKVTYLDYVRISCRGMYFRSSASFRFVLLLVVIAWLALGIHLFTSGFLLSRREINITSTCQNDAHSRSSTCWTLPSIVGTYKKVVVIIIDALRFDFAFYQTNSSNDLPYINKLKIFKDLANQYGCSSARLFKFRADAPTTTMQRIKGMTTGSFPTFIDISNNFDSSEISEDNLIDQILKNDGANLTFMGDDTWVKLFPNRFANSFPFPSFDVKDLHLVDDGIIRHLVPELQKQNWKVLIAHFLGVDHCGHRYGPMHRAMAKKLKQMDSVLRSVVNTLDNETLLLVMGDHGMTRTGDHGGETTEEIDSALFAFSRNGKFAHAYSPNCYNGLVHQVDIVPTLSLLLGTPIPFSNLGSVIADFVPDPSTNLRDALLTNVAQIETYLNEYSTRYSEFNSAKFRALMENFAKIREKNSTSNEILQLLHNARDLCKSIWAHFDEMSMILGACLICTICTLLLDMQKRSMLMLFFLPALYCCYSYVVSAEFQLLSLFFSSSLLIVRALTFLYDGQIGMAGLLSILYPIVYFSNSFVINEDVIVFYIYCSVISLVCLRVLQQTSSDCVKKQVKGKKSNRGYFKVVQSFIQLIKRPYGTFLLLVVSTIFLLRTVFVFRVCRPEQFWCFAQDARRDNYGDSSVSAIYAIDEFLDLSNTWTRLFVCGGSLVGTLWCLYERMKQGGNMRNTYSAPVVCTGKLLPFTVACIVGNWQLHTVSAEELESLPSLFVTFLPLCAYILLLLSLLWWFLNPLTVHLLYQDKYGRYRDQLTLTEDELISYYFNEIKQQLDSNSSTKLRKKSNESDSIASNACPADLGKPAVFGLYTFFSAALIGFGALFLLFGAMLLEERYAPVLFAFVITSRLLLEILSAIHHRQNRKNFLVSCDAVGIWMLSCSFWWFVTGHQASLSSIPWNAAFVGFRGSHPTVVLPAIMVGTNIFISQILHTVFLPLLLLWPITNGYWFLQVQNKSDNANDVAPNSEFDFVQSSDFWHAFTDLFYKHIFMHALKVFVCVCAAFIHRRHLMVWQIFAPRFVYEVLGFCVVCVTSLLVFVFTFLFRRSFNAWLRKEKLNAAVFIKT